MRKIWFVVTMILTLLLLAACGGNAVEEAPTAAPEPTAVEEAPAPTEAPTSDDESEAETEEADTAAEAYPAEEEAAAPELADAAEEAYPAAPELADADAAEEAYPMTDEGEAVTVEETDTAAQIYTIVPDESQASYIVKEEFFQGAVDRLEKALGLTDTVGSTRQIEGQIGLTEDFELVSGEFIVNLRSLTSDETRRDERIREEWLQSSLYPEATFVITDVEGIPADYTEGEEVNFQMTGDMTIREITQPVTFDVTATMTEGQVTGTATTQLTMTDFGFEPPAILDFFTVEDLFTVEVEFVAEQS